MSVRVLQRKLNKRERGKTFPACGQHHLIVRRYAFEGYLVPGPLSVLLGNHEVSNFAPP
jgi:hypothetical protein